jgi:hypothetical protein
MDLSKGFLLHESILSRLNAKERFVYQELTRLAVFKKEGEVHPEYGVLVPQGAFILSYRKLAEIVELFPEATLRRIIKRLADLKLIEVRPLEGKGGSMFIINNYAELQMVN